MQFKLDKNGHLIVDHDLHNHVCELPDGIADAFIEFAKAENLSFWAGGVTLQEETQGAEHGVASDTEIDI